MRFARGDCSPSKDSLKEVCAAWLFELTHQPKDSAKETRRSCEGPFACTAAIMGDSERDAARGHEGPVVFPRVVGTEWRHLRKGDARLPQAIPR